MQKISINLLPVEFNLEQIQRAKFYKVQIIGVGIILLLTFLSSLTIALRILQSHNINQAQGVISNEEQRINNLKDTQASLLILKNRLTAISQYLGTASSQSSIYNLFNKLLPPQVIVSSLSIDRLGQVVVSAVSSDVTSLDELISNLTDTSNQDKISEVLIDSLSRGKDGIYRISLKIKQKG